MKTSCCVCVTTATILDTCYLVHPWRPRRISISRLQPSCHFIFTNPRGCKEIPRTPRPPIFAGRFSPFDSLFQRSYFAMDGLYLRKKKKQRRTHRQSPRRCTTLPAAGRESRTPCCRSACPSRRVRYSTGVSLSRIDQAGEGRSVDCHRPKQSSSKLRLQAKPPPPRPSHSHPDREIGSAERVHESVRPGREQHSLLT